MEGHLKKTTFGKNYFTTIPKALKLRPFLPQGS